MYYFFNYVKQLTENVAHVHTLYTHKNVFNHLLCEWLICLSPTAARSRLNRFLSMYVQYASPVQIYTNAILVTHNTHFLSKCISCIDCRKTSHLGL